MWELMRLLSRDSYSRFSLYALWVSTVPDAVIAARNPPPLCADVNSVDELEPLW
jgi:hypothetical protein